MNKTLKALASAAFLSVALTGCQTSPHRSAEGSTGAAVQSGTAGGFFAPASEMEALEARLLPDAFSFGDLRHPNRATRDGRIIPN